MHTQNQTIGLFSEYLHYQLKVLKKCVATITGRGFLSKVLKSEILEKCLPVLRYRKYDDIQKYQSPYMNNRQAGKEGYPFLIPPKLPYFFKNVVKFHNCPVSSFRTSSNFIIVPVFHFSNFYIKLCTLHLRFTS